MDFNAMIDGLRGAFGGSELLPLLLLEQAGTTPRVVPSQTCSAPHLPKHRLP